MKKSELRALVKEVLEENAADNDATGVSNTSDDDIAKSIVKSLTQLKDGTYYRGWLTGVETPKQTIEVVIRLIRQEWRV